MNKKYVIDLISRDADSTAQYKPKNDIAKILNQQGFKVISYIFYNSKIKKLFSVNSIRRKLKNLNQDVLVYQYPLGTKKVDKIFINTIKNNSGLLKIAIIHDLESLRYNTNQRKSILEEIKELNTFNGLIVHNELMQKWLNRNGINVPMVNLGIFDYLTISRNKIKNRKNRIVFAGNLKKAAFLTKLNINTQVDVYGPNPNLDFYPNDVDYKGQLPSDKLIQVIDQKFGLIWDGNSLNECTGIYGNYERYNSPHKMSLYICSMTPIIAWKGSAIARFIEKNNIGFTINNLNEIDNILINIKPKEYQIMRNNIKNISYKVQNGFYTKVAVKNLMKIIKEN